MINGGAKHLGVATDHVIESFRNRLWPGYKTGEGIDPDLFAQFPLLEEGLVAPSARGFRCRSRSDSPRFCLRARSA